MKWIIEPEYVSFIIIVILILNTSLFNKRALSFATRFFNVCLYISLISIFLNIITVFTIYYASYIPIWINNSLNTIFFIFIPLVSVSVAVYSLIIIYEHNPNKKGLEKAIALIFLVYILYLALLLTNPYTGFIFRFDEANNYNRGH